MTANIAYTDYSTIVPASWLNSADGCINTDTIAELRLLSRTNGNNKALVSGYYAKFDGGGGLYQLDLTDASSPDNGGSVIVANDGGRWKLQVINSISPRQFGAKGKGPTNDDSTAFNNMLAWVWTLTKSRNLFNGSPNLGQFVIDGGGAEYGVGNIISAPTTGGGGIVMQNMMLTAMTPLANNPILLFSSSTAGYQNLTFRNITFNGANNTGLSGITLLKIYNAHNVVIDANCFVGYGNGAYGLYTDSLSNDVRVTNNYFQQWIAGEHDNIHDKTGIACNFVGPDNYFCHNIVAAAGTGLQCNSNTTVTHNHFYGIDNWAIDINTGSQVYYMTIEDNYFDQSSIHYVGPYLGTIKNNRFIALNRGCAIQFEPLSAGWSVSQFGITGNSMTGAGYTVSGAITPSATSGNITISDTVGDFSTATWNTQAGSIISGNGGIALVTGVISSTEVSATTLVAFNSTSQIAAGAWTIQQSFLFKDNFGVNGAFGIDAVSFNMTNNNNGGLYYQDAPTGTFVPTLIGSSGTSNHTYNTQAGFYRVINEIVYFRLTIVLTTKDSGMGGNCTIQGLPYTSSALAGDNSALDIGYISDVTLSAGYSQFSAYLGASSNQIVPVMLGTGVPQASLAAANITNNSSFTISGWYPAY